MTASASVSSKGWSCWAAITARQLVSVHDPDEYLDAAASPADRERRFDDILGAYTALGEMKARAPQARHRRRRQELEVDPGD